MNNLLERLQSQFNTALTAALAKSFGEQESAINKASQLSFPTIISGILHHSITSPHELETIFMQAVIQQSVPANLIGNITSGNFNTPLAQAGSNLLLHIFGDKFNGISNLITHHSGVQSHSSNTILGISGAIVANFLGNKMNSEALHVSGIIQWLQTHQDTIEQLLPADIKQFISGNPIAEKNTTPVTENHLPNMPAQTPKNQLKWVLPLILLGLFGVGLFFWMNGCNREQQATNDVETTLQDAGNSINQAVDKAAQQLDTSTSHTEENTKGTLDADSNWIAPKGSPIKIKLADGKEIDAYLGSAEDRLYNFITDPAAEAAKDIWFNLEDVLFAPGKSSLKPGSDQQLDNVVAIIQAYPTVKIKLGGYTDQTGDSLANVKLSSARAKTVYMHLLQKGLTKAAFDEKPYEGYGPQYPVSDNQTAEGRAQNRRIAISVRAK